MKLTDQPTGWEDPAAVAIGAIVGEYNRGVRRSDLGSVRRLLARFAPARPGHHVVIVGTNGKTSTATFLARLLGGHGAPVGLYTSPHIARWSERVRIDDVSVDDDELIATLTAVHRRASEDPAPHPDLRFFDVLTLAAEDIFGRAGVEVAVFEAGIGGRLDATRVLEPGLVALTCVGDDHREQLGPTAAEILIEKLAAAPRGATLVAGPLGSRLTAEARGWAVREGVELVEAGGSAAVVPNLPAFQQRNLELAVRAAELAEAKFGLPAPSRDARYAGDIAGVWGRFEPGEVDGVRYVADVAHNQSAWLELLGELTRTWPERRWVAVLAVTAERRPAELAAAVAGAGSVVHVIATITPVRAASEPAEIVAAFERTGERPTAETCDMPEAAFSRAAGLARRHDLDLLVTGSNYLASAFLAWVAKQTQQEIQPAGPPVAATWPPKPPLERPTLAATPPQPSVDRGDREALPRADVLIESIRNDPIPAEFVSRFRVELQRELGGGSSAAPAYSALEAAGQMWWLCVYLWLISARSRGAIDALLDTVTPIATELRASTPERRPVYVALLDPEGLLLQARLVRTGVERMPIRSQRSRPFPAQPDPRFGR